MEKEKPNVMIMTKEQFIEAIREINLTASVEFLSQFSVAELQEYLNRLNEIDLNDSRLLEYLDHIRE